MTMRKTVSRGCPSAAARGQPVSCWATGFRKVTRPAASVAITASPMLVRMAWSSCRCSWIMAADRWRARRPRISRPMNMPTAASSQGIHHLMRVGHPPGVLVQLPDVPVRQTGVDGQQDDDAGEGGLPVEGAMGRYFQAGSPPRFGARPG